MSYYYLKTAIKVCLSLAIALLPVGFLLTAMTEQIIYLGCLGAVAMLLTFASIIILIWI